MKRQTGIIISSIFFISISCNKGGGSDNPPTPAGPFNHTGTLVNGNDGGLNYRNVSRNSIIKLNFSAPVGRNTVAANVLFNELGGAAVSYNTSYEKNDSVLVIQPSSPLNYLSKYTLRLSSGLSSSQQKALGTSVMINLFTTLDSSRKFPAITDNELLDKVQQQTFKYFWNFGHPVSGLARERNTSGDLVTSGGSGFGIMTIITAVHRGWITRAEALTRLQTMVSFLKNTAQKFHGAFPHWLNGATGAVIPFSTKDNGADLVETSYLIQGLLCARQYFNDAGAAETTLRNDINSIWQAVEWSWFRNGGQNVLYWHWSPNYGWDMNLPIRGWNECLITYVLAASSTTSGIPATVYNNGWKASGNNGFINGNTYLGYQLPLGPAGGGPLFFAHYSFLGINPNGLSDVHTNYLTQNKNHTLINYTYCRSNLMSYYGYSDSVWGLTASDIKNGYTASSPTHDLGFIAPTAALSSFPYTPAESMAALKFFYYVLGDKLWKEYGFIDAFSLNEPWFADSFLAIDQGPIIIMIENYRSGLLWNLFTSCPEVKTGMLSLGFTAPYL
ncbi:MAG TPA: glucoamylase family protein [Chitinophagaceae bacterium]|jgi:hypothetical protein|nr:glucoamylase family protein [Chitinophagaceae bacterium]